MNIKKYNEFAAFWQQLVSIAKVAFASKSVTATNNFKQAYKHNTALEYGNKSSDDDTPVAIEPMQSKCRAAAIGCYIIMKSGHVYEAVIRTKMSQGKGIVHLVWFVAKDAESRPLITIDDTLIKDDSPTEEVVMKQG